jgi:hypothetical protein
VVYFLHGTQWFFHGFEIPRTHSFFMLIFSKYLNPMFLFASDSFKYTELAVITKMKEATHTLLDSFFVQLEEVGSQEMLRDMRTYSLKLIA